MPFQVDVIFDLPLIMKQVQSPIAIPIMWLQQLLAEYTIFSVNFIHFGDIQLGCNILNWIRKIHIVIILMFISFWVVTDEMFS